MALPEYGNKMKEEKISNFCIKKNNFNEMKSNELCFQPAIPMYHYPVFFYICPHLWPCSKKKSIPKNKLTGIIKTL